MQCKKCGNELAEGASFCPKCGCLSNQGSGKTQYKEPTQAVYPEENIYEPAIRKSSIDSILIGVLVALIVVVAVLLVVFSMTMFGKEESRESKKEADTVVEQNTMQNLEEKTENSVATTEAVSSAVATTEAISATSTEQERGVELTASTTAATTAAVQETTQVGPIPSPNWEVYKDPDYGFSIKYPSHFVLYNDEGTRNRYTLSAPDGTADLRIFSYEDPGLSPEELGREFENTWGGERQYFKTGKKYYAVRTSRDGVCYYEYGERSVGKGVTGFTLIYDASYHSIYDDYVNIIYQSRSWKK